MAPTTRLAITILLVGCFTLTVTQAMTPLWWAGPTILVGTTALVGVCMGLAWLYIAITDWLERRRIRKQLKELREL